MDFFTELLQKQQKLEEEKVDGYRHKILVKKHGEEKAKEIEAVGKMLEYFNDATAQARAILVLKEFESEKEDKRD